MAYQWYNVPQSCYPSSATVVWNGNSQYNTQPPPYQPVHSYSYQQPAMPYIAPVQACVPMYNNVPVQQDLMQLPIYNNAAQVHVPNGLCNPCQWSNHLNQQPFMRQQVQYSNPHSLVGRGQNMTINTNMGRMEMHQSVNGQTMNITHY